MQNRPLSNHYNPMRIGINNNKRQRIPKKSDPRDNNLIAFCDWSTQHILLDDDINPHPELNTLTFRHQWSKSDIPCFFYLSTSDFHPVSQPGSGVFPGQVIDSHKTFSLIGRMRPPDRCGSYFCPLKFNDITYKKIKVHPCLMIDTRSPIPDLLLD